MALYLVQHGLSLSKDEDPQKGLSAAGAAQSCRIAEVAAGYGVKVARIVHSGKKRALETARIFDSHLSPPDGLAAVDGINPLDDVSVWAERLDPTANLMMVGHLPFLQRLLGLLTVGNPELMVFKFQNSGIVCLEKTPETNAWHILWSLSPKIGSR